MILCGLAACAPAVPQPPAATLLNAPQASEANPLQKEGQILLKIRTAEVKGLEKAPTDAAGLLQADDAEFRIARENGPELVSGKVKQNEIHVPVDKLGKGPYQLTITLAGGEVLTARLQDTLNEGEKRVIQAENVTVVTTTQTCGDNCTQVGDDVNIVQTGKIEGPNCPGIGNQCSSGARR